jgi:hypothetical protein
MGLTAGLCFPYPWKRVDSLGLELRPTGSTFDGVRPRVRRPNARAIVAIILKEIILGILSLVDIKTPSLSSMVRRGEEIFERRCRHLGSYMTNQVLHHLPTDDLNGFQHRIKVLCPLSLLFLEVRLFLAPSALSLVVSGTRSRSMGALWAAARRSVLRRRAIDSGQAELHGEVVIEEFGVVNCTKTSFRL